MTQNAGCVLWRWLYGGCVLWRWWLYCGCVVWRCIVVIMVVVYCGGGVVVAYCGGSLGIMKVIG